MNQKTQKIINNVMVLPLVERAEVVQEVIKLTQEEIIANSSIFGLESNAVNITSNEPAVKVVEKIVEKEVEVIKEVRSQEDIDLIAKLQAEIQSLKSIKTEEPKQKELVKEEVKQKKEVISDDIHILSHSSTNKDIMFGLWHKDGGVYRFCANKKVSKPVVFGNCELNEELGERLLALGLIYDTDSSINVLVDEINNVEAGIYQLNNTKTLTGYYGEDYVFFISWDEKKGEYYTKPRVCRTKDLVEIGEHSKTSRSELAKQAAIAMKDLFIGEVLNPSVDADYGDYTRAQVREIIDNKFADVKRFIGDRPKKKQIILNKCKDLYPGVTCEDELFTLWYLDKKDSKKKSLNLDTLVDEVYNSGEPVSVFEEM